MSEKKPFDIAEFNRQMIANLTQEVSRVKDDVRFALKQISLVKAAVKELLDEKLSREKK